MKDESTSAEPRDAGSLVLPKIEFPPAPNHGEPEITNVLKYLLDLYQREVDRITGELHFWKADSDHWRKSSEFWMMEATKYKMMLHTMEHDYTGGV